MTTDTFSTLTNWERVLHFSLRMLPLYKPHYLAFLYETQSTERALQLAIASVAELTVRQYQSAGALHQIWENMPDFAVQEPLWEILLAYQWFATMPLDVSPSMRRWGYTTIENFGSTNALDAWCTLHSTHTVTTTPAVGHNAFNVFGLDIKAAYSHKPIPLMERFPHWGGYLVAGHAIGLLPAIEQLEALHHPQEQPLLVPNSF